MASHSHNGSKSLQPLKREIGIGDGLSDKKGKSNKTKIFRYEKKKEMKEKKEKKKEKKKRKRKKEKRERGNMNTKKQCNLQRV